MQIVKGATVQDSLITDGCVVSAGARVERSILSPGVFVGPDAVVRDSVILTDTRIELETHCLRRSIQLGDIAWEGRVISALHQLVRTPLHSRRNGTVVSRRRTDAVRATWTRSIKPSLRPRWGVISAPPSNVWPPIYA